jgi:hypothetical protein
VTDNDRIPQAVSISFYSCILYFGFTSEKAARKAAFSLVD